MYNLLVILCVTVLLTNAMVQRNTIDVNCGFHTGTISIPKGYDSYGKPIALGEIIFNAGHEIIKKAEITIYPQDSSTIIEINKYYAYSGTQSKCSQSYKAGCVIQLNNIPKNTRISTIITVKESSSYYPPLIDIRGVKCVKDVYPPPAKVYSKPVKESPAYTRPAKAAPAKVAPVKTVPAYTPPEYKPPVYTPPAYKPPVKPKAKKVTVVSGPIIVDYSRGNVATIDINCNFATGSLSVSKYGKSVIFFNINKPDIKEIRFDILNKEHSILKINQGFSKPIIKCKSPSICSLSLDTSLLSGYYINRIPTLIIPTTAKESYPIIYIGNVKCLTKSDLWLEKKKIIGPVHVDESFPPGRISTVDLNCYSSIASILVSHTAHGRSLIFFTVNSAKKTDGYTYKLTPEYGTKILVDAGFGLDKQECTNLKPCIIGIQKTLYENFGTNRIPLSIKVKYGIPYGYVKVDISHVKCGLGKSAYY